MSRYFYPAVAYVAGAVVLAANWNVAGGGAGLSPASIAGIALAAASIWWIAAAATARGPRVVRAALVILPSIPPLALAILALQESDAGLLGVLAAWPHTILTPIVSLVGLLAIMLQATPPQTDAG